MRVLQAFNTKMKALEGSAARLLPALFELLARLGEVESMVRALQLVSILVEVLGRQALPVLGTIAEYLPKVGCLPGIGCRIGCRISSGACHHC